MGQENQTQKTIGFNIVGRKTRPRDHIWAKTIYGIQHSGTRKSDPKDDTIQHSWLENQTQRPYMGKDHIWDSTQWDRKIRPKKTLGFNTVGRKTRPKYHICAKTIYGQRPYMGFNTVGQENQTQKTIRFNTVGRKTRPRDHIWAKTIYGIQHSGTGKPDPKTIYGQRPYMGFNTVGQGNRTQRQ